MMAYNEKEQNSPRDDRLEPSATPVSQETPHHSASEDPFLLPEQSVWRNEGRLSWDHNVENTQDRPPQVFHPWRRYLARTLDLNLYCLLWSALLGFVFHINLTSRGTLASLLDSFVGLLIMLCVEPFFLHWLGTTPGKALFGLRVHDINGQLLTLAEARWRTWGVISAGMGYGIPIYTLYRSWQSYKLCQDGTVQPWDEADSYTIRDVKPLRGIAFACAVLVLIALNVTLLQAQQLPPNRGDLTISKFAKNYQYYADYFDVDLRGLHLDQNGQWAETPHSSTNLYAALASHPSVTYEYTVEEGVLTGISFVAERDGSTDLLSAYDLDMMLISLAFLGAQREVWLFSSDLADTTIQILDAPFGTFQFTTGGLTVSCETTYQGFHEPIGNLLIPDEDAASPHFRQVFSIRK